MTETFIAILVSLLGSTLVLPILTGYYAGRSVGRGHRRTFPILLVGIPFCFAVAYLRELGEDLTYKAKYFPNASYLHTFGPDWSSELFLGATDYIWYSYAAFVISFFIARKLASDWRDQDVQET